MATEDSNITKVDGLGGGDAGDALGRSKWVNETWSTYLPLTVAILVLTMYHMNHI
jgi:hypothetical protein